MANWINDKLIELDWSQRELARRAGIAHTTVSKVLSGQVSPTADFCAAIARAFGERPETVLRIAGLLPATAGPLELSEDEGNLVTWYRQASPTMKPHILKTVKGLSEP